MTTFVEIAKAGVEPTQEGAVQYSTSGDTLIDLFSVIGSWRGRGNFYSGAVVDIVERFKKAYESDPRLAVQILCWSRDPRHGAGSRDAFKRILQWLAVNDPKTAKSIIGHIGEIGRFDDAIKALFDSRNKSASAREVFEYAVRKGWATICSDDSKAPLAAKWFPRKGKLAGAIRSILKVTPKEYRKKLVAKTNVVETQMCNNEWDKIEFDKVPSVAFSRYKVAFSRHDEERYYQFLSDVAENKKKINASVVYPHDVVRSIIDYMTDHYYSRNYESIINNLPVSIKATDEQWKQLPVQELNIGALPMIDMSASMNSCYKNSTAPIYPAIALGYLMAEKINGPFNGIVSTFSTDPVFYDLCDFGDGISERIIKSYIKYKESWGMATNFYKAIEMMLELAKANNVAEEDMPKALVVFSDMQFSSCASPSINVPAYNAIKKKYAEAGYKVPLVVFWNLQGYTGSPVFHRELGVFCISGFSTAVMNVVFEIIEKLNSGEKFSMVELIRSTVSARQEWDLYVP